MGPKNEEESTAFNKMTKTLKNSSSAVGWAINQGDIFTQSKGYIQGELFQRVKGRLPGVDSRLTTGYAVCLYFAEKVC